MKLSRVFDSVEEPEQAKDLSQRYFSKAKYMGDHCQGQAEIKLNSIGPTIRAEHHGNIEFRRLSKAHGGKIDHELNTGLPERRLTGRECALIQTFPNWNHFGIFILIGNSDSLCKSRTGKITV